MTTGGYSDLAGLLRGLGFQQVTCEHMRAKRSGNPAMRDRLDCVAWDYPVRLTDTHVGFFFRVHVTFKPKERKRVYNHPRGVKHIYVGGTGIKDQRVPMYQAATLARMFVEEHPVT